jgi:DNA helicase HerA-like ATPase
MTEYKIGKVISVSADTINISLYDYSDSDETVYGVPDNMNVTIDTSVGPTPVLIGQPGTFVLVAIPNGMLLSMITDISMKETSVLNSEIKKAESSDEYLIQSPLRIITVIPVGTIDASGIFERGTDLLPTVSNDVFAVLPDVIDKVYESFAEGNFSIGELSLIKNQEAKINLDSFLSRHAAILGQTGGGKSWTVASIIQSISTFPKSTVVLFDLHNEYKAAFGDYAEYINASDLEFPYWLMKSDELLGLMVDRAESAAPNQIAKFKELLQAAKENHIENQALGIPKITIDTPVHFDFKNIIDEFRRLDVQMVPGAVPPKLIKGPLNGDFTRLLMRIDSRLNDKRYDLIFNPIIYNTSASMEVLFRKILGEEPEPKKIVIVDMSSIPFDVRNSIISLILRCLFDFAYWYKKVNSKAYPVSVFCDEAHIYFNDKDPNSEAARLSAERIAKEGRKYGISLTVISQRPREVSATILSQCNTFLCLRISNPEDQSYVKSLLPDSIRGIVSMFSNLRRGECILLGDSVIMPTRIKIRKPDPTPNSDDTSFYKEWHLDHEEIQIAPVLDAWRKQQVE